MSSETQNYHHGHLRKAILTLALQLLEDEGVEAITMRELGYRLNVSHTAAYRHFPSKEAVLAALAQAGFEHLTEQLHAIRTDDAVPFHDKYRLLGVEYIKFAVQHPQQYRLMYGSAAVARKAFPDLYRAARELAREVHVLVEQCQQNRTLHDGDAGQMAQAAWSLAHGAAMLVIDGHIRVDNLDAFAHQMTHHLRTGIAALDAAPPT